MDITKDNRKTLQRALVGFELWSWQEYGDNQILEYLVDKGAPGMDHYQDKDLVEENIFHAAMHATVSNWEIKPREIAELAGVDKGDLKVLSKNCMIREALDPIAEGYCDEKAVEYEKLSDKHWENIFSSIIFPNKFD